MSQTTHHTWDHRRGRMTLLILPAPCPLAPGYELRVASSWVFRQHVKYGFNKDQKVYFMSDQTAGGSSLKKIATELTKITAVMENQSNLHPALKAPTFTPFKAPGPESNSLDWVFVLRMHFCSRVVFYVLKQVNPANQTPEWRQDNLAVVLVLASTVDPCNLCFIRNFKEDAAGMLAALRAAHQDSSTGGRMYWLRKLVLSRMSGDNVKSHIDEMVGYTKLLNSLISTSNPLTADKVHAAALLISLLDEWLHCVSLLMNKERVMSAKVVTALKQEAYRRKLCNEDSSNPTSASSAKTPKLPTKDNRDKTQTSQTRFCTFCKKEGHSLSHCCQTARVFCDHKSNHPAKSNTTPGRNNSAQPTATAGRTSTTPLGGTAHKSEPYFSGLELEVTASNTVCSLFASRAA
ncbi:hypothetical protein PCASD_13761 [Puccinia coronata f. sp. avenae]|uniref:Uncharacterized protein n=1 Tax=Puccinia coronata f. sp. avenae TaxID=200324 RepID=A0A2N5ULA2_9BASI|nr:hypothetical protein PCASD_13761 [Puccinia coronata f. sp. avenae]